MNINELINKLNDYCKNNDICDIERMDKDIYTELKSLDFNFVQAVEYDEHRWYVLALNVYSVTIQGIKYYIGVWEVDTLKSERMSVSDCDCQLEFFEMEQYTTVSYRAKEENNNA